MSSIPDTASPQILFAENLLGDLLTAVFNRMCSWNNDFVQYSWMFQAFST